MAIDVDPPLDLDLESGRWTLRLDSKELAEVLKSSAVMASFAAAILSSAYLAYTDSPRWAAITATVVLINIYAMPKILRHCNTAMIQKALAVNLASVSCLFLGGIAAATFSMGRTQMASLKTYQFSTALFCAFGMTALLGYCIPFFRDALGKACKLLTDPEEVKENFSNLQEQFHRMPEMGLGLLQTNLWQSFILQLALFKPDIVLSFWEFLFINSPHYVWSMAAAASERVTLEQFQEMLTTFEEDAAISDHNPEDLADDLKENYYYRLKITIERMDKEDLGQAIAWLLESGPKFIPCLLSNERFLDLFIDDVLDATNVATQIFLDQTADWPDLINRLGDVEGAIAKQEEDILQFEEESKNVLDQKDAPPKTQEELSAKHEELCDQNLLINQEFSALRFEVEKVYVNKRTWQKFAPLWSDEQQLPFENGDELLSLLHDQPYMDEIDETYRSMVGTGQGQNKTVSDRLQLITNKLCSLDEQEEEEEPLSAIFFLAANQAFIQQDFEDLQEWLNLDSPNELEEGLAAIGLETENDLYFHGILQSQENQDKEEILKNLRQFIVTAHKSGNLAGRMESIEETDIEKRAFKLGEMVSRVVYHAICSGLILVPFLIHPYAGLTGFVIGSAVFILVRFGVQKAVDLVNLGNQMIDSIPLGNLMRNLIGRRVFSLSPQRREGANQFVSSDFFGKMRIINSQMIAAIVISYLSIRIEQPFMGSFLQGVALADELVYLI